jgi:error-prone DNA polymerase
MSAHRPPPPETAAPAYAELQATSNFTFLAGGSHPDELVAQAKALGLTALALTDRNTLAGVVRAHVAAKQVGLRLIVGTRLDLTDGHSLLCLPTDRAAYGRLCRLLSLGQRRAGKGACLLNLDDIVAYAEGQILIALPPDGWDWREAIAQERAKPANISAQPPPPPTTGGPTQIPGTATSARIIPFPDRSSTGPGEHKPSPRASLRSPPSSSLETWLRRLASVLPSPIYLAAAHRYRGDDRARIAALATLAERTGLRLVATNDVLYHAPQRRELQDVLTCIRQGITIDAAGQRLEANAERHLKSPAAMARLFRGFGSALTATLEIAGACRFSLDELVYEYPNEPVPPDKTPQAHLEDLTSEGARWRFPGGIPDKVRDTLARELALIQQLDYAPYFLTVHDIVVFARSRAILCQGRGSAANSVVCYCLGITAVDPTEVDLLFERFVSPERKEPPDIDVDFEHDRREEVIQYIYARYGRHRAGLAATVISYRARSAVRDVGKAMGLSADTVAALASMVWGTRSGGVLPEKHVREAGLDPTDPLLARVIELSSELSSFPRHLSQHVGGFVLTRGRLDEVVPVGNAAMTDRTVIEWDKDDIGALGLLKVDVLALGMLSCIRRAFALLHTHHAQPMTLAGVPRADGATFDMLCRADSIGVFQVESRAQMNMLPRLKPRTFYDLVIEVAIVRPGPIQGDMVHPYLRRRSGLEPEHYPSPAHGDKNELRDILAKTKGVPLFQEQAMRIAMVAARFSDAEVNELRKAMATFRRVGTIGQLETKMVEAMVARGYARDFAERCFNQIKGFGEYGFPESHAASFAHLVYVSAWLKCHYPAAFACALLNSQPMGFYAPAQIVRDAREHGVTVLPVDVNHSDWDCTLEVDGLPGNEARNPPSATSPALRLGLRQVDGLNQAEVQQLIQARAQVAEKGLQGEGHQSHAFSLPPPFPSVHALWMHSGISHTTLEKLAAADTFRSIRTKPGVTGTGLDRRQALWEVKALAGAEPLPLFQWQQLHESGPEPAVNLPAMPLSEHVVNDYQTLRLSLKAHPMSFLREHMRRQRIAACMELRTLKDGAAVTVAGVVLVRQRPGSAKGVVFMTLEDETGIANAVIWPKTLDRYRKVVMSARLILIKGRIQRHEDIIHVVSARLEDRSDWLLALSDEAATMRIPIANADEVARPEPGSARGTEAKPARHPRYTRVIPKSRDFH